MGKGRSGGVVRIAPEQAGLLVDAYRRAGGTSWNVGVAIAPSLYRAGQLLERSVDPAAFHELALLLGEDADDLEWRLEFLRATDGFTISLHLRTHTPPIRAWMARDASELGLDQLAVLLAGANNQTELAALVDWIHRHDVFENNDLLGEHGTIPWKYRDLFGGAFSVAYSGGWRPDGGVPPWLAAGMAKHGHLADDALIELASVALDERYDFGNHTNHNPFVIDDAPSAFSTFADELIARPDAGRAFINTLLDEHDATGDTRLNMHGSHGHEILLADIVVASGTSGDLGGRTEFVDRLVRTINADGDSNEPVFYATWAVHAELVLEHDITTTEPAFGVHHLMPDALRPAWEQTWNDDISPVVLNRVFVGGRRTLTAVDLAKKIGTPGQSLVSAVRERLFPTIELGNDAGGTYSTRAKQDFPGMRSHFSGATQGRNIITHALRDGSNHGDIYQDEFAIISHGLGANGRPTYTINLPGVIDLSSPMPGFDPTHSTVRDMDQAALDSATSAQVSDNLYAQMVVRALDVNDVPIGANLMLVGHSFGADTAADLASNPGFNDDYNLTHVVAAAYDSEPQLANVDPSINVLVLQNEDDKAIFLEATQRAAAASFESVSVNTFAHEVRKFDGGWGVDIGHHQDRYIDYLDTTSDDVLDAYFESVSAVGYGEPGTSVAIDVTLDESLLSK